MTLIIIIFFIYKTFFNKKLKVVERVNLPKICVYINSDNYNEILKVLTLQTYPNDLFDIYINNNESFNYKNNIYKYNHDQIRNTNYDLITVINDIVDLNYLNFTAKEFMKGYDIIFGSSHYNTSLLLVKRTINKIINNSIHNDCFSFNKELFDNNVINIKNTLTLKMFLIKKTKLISYNSNIKTIGNTNTYNTSFFIINPLDKRFFYFKIYLYSYILLILSLTNNLLYFLLLLYIYFIISNLLFLYKNHKIKLVPVLLLPINLIIYFINYLFFRINNKRSNIKSI